MGTRRSSFGDQKVALVAIDDCHQHLLRITISVLIMGVTLIFPSTSKEFVVWPKHAIIRDWNRMNCLYNPLQLIASGILVSLCVTMNYYELQTSEADYVHQSLVRGLVNK